MNHIYLRLLLTFSIIAALLSSCIISEESEVIAYCDRIVVNYVDDGYGGNGTIIVRIEGGHEAGSEDVSIPNNGGTHTSGTVTVHLDDDYPDGTTFTVVVGYYIPYYGYTEDTIGSDTCSTAGHHIKAHGATWFDPGDSRLNRQAYAYAAIYCDDTNQRVGIYGIHSASTDGGEPGKGFPAIFVGYDALPPTPTLEQGNTLIQQYLNVSFYRLTSGEYQVNAGPDNEGKTYVVVFDGCPNTYMHAYMEQNGVLTPSEVYPH